MTKSQKWIIGIIITLIISLGTVVVLHWFPHQWCVNSLSTDGLAGLLGAVISSLVTLGILFITTMQTRRQIKENRDEQKQIRLEDKQEANRKYNLDLAFKLGEKIADIIKTINVAVNKDNFEEKDFNEITGKMTNCFVILSLIPNSQELNKELIQNIEEFKKELHKVGSIFNDRINGVKTTAESRQSIYDQIMKMDKLVSALMQSILK